jgi:sporulation protein YlmC with PRC-barrel domain
MLQCKCKLAAFRGTRKTPEAYCWPDGTVGSLAGFSMLVSLWRKAMFAKHIAAGLAASALLATVAFAQTQTPTATTDRANTPPAASSDSSFQGNWRTSKLVGLNVYNDNNENLGSINDLLADKSGSIKAVVIGVGGFLGVGTQLIAVPFDKVKFVNEPVAYTGAAATGAAGSPNAAANRPALPTTTGAATTNNTATTMAKPNPWYPDHAVLNATKDELKAMPEFKYST